MEDGGRLGAVGDGAGGVGVDGEVDGEGDEAGEDGAPLPGELACWDEGTGPPASETTLLGGAKRFCLRRKQWPVRKRTTRPKTARVCESKRVEKAGLGDGNHALV